jgi:glycine cleavage system regulatory protein
MQLLRIEVGGVDHCHLIGEFVVVLSISAINVESMASKSRTKSGERPISMVDFRVFINTGRLELTDQL